MDHPVSASSLSFEAKFNLAQRQEEPIPILKTSPISRLSINRKAPYTTWDNRHILSIYQSWTNPGILRNILGY